jgi:hypothetical protein
MSSPRSAAHYSIAVWACLGATSALAAALPCNQLAFRREDIAAMPLLLVRWRIA